MAENNNNEFHDSLDDVIARATEKFKLTNEDVPEDTSSQIINHEEYETQNEESFDEEPNSSIIPKSILNHIPNDTLDDVDIEDDTLGDVADDFDDDPYGVNDANREIEEEDRIREEERLQKIEEARIAKEALENSKKTLPPRSLDMEFQNKAMKFQEDKLAIVTGMVERVKAKYHLVGGIKPERQRHVMGDLIEYYENYGEEITDTFENIILNNWQHVDENGQAYGNTENVANENINDDNNPSAVDDDNNGNVNVNIDVAPNQPVTVNIDDDVVKSINKKRVVNINVREMTNADMDKIVVIENSPKEGIIRSFETGIGYTPITLPLSGYRCMIKPLNFFDMISMTAPNNNSIVDYQLKRWRTIYDHLKNPSIGEFENFEDFLKKTKYNDLPLLEWGLLTATSDDEESLTLECGNPKCKQEFVHMYTPRTLIHPNPDKLPPEFDEISRTSGQRAIDIFTAFNTKRVRYKLPISGIIIEINEPSAYYHLYTTLPLIVDRYRAKFPDDPTMEHFQNIQQYMQRDPRIMEFAITSSMITRISAIVVPPPEDENYNEPHEYRFTNWDDIEEQLGMIPMDDTLAIFKIVSEADDHQPMEFYVSGIQCPHCGRKEPRGLPVTNLVENLIFRVSRRLQNTEINLTKLD